MARYTIVRDWREAALSEGRRITDVNQSAVGYANYQQWIPNAQLEDLDVLAQVIEPYRRFVGAPPANQENEAAAR